MEQKLEKIAAIKEKVNKIAAKRDKEIADYQEKIKTAKEREAAAHEAIDKAYKAAKVEEFHKAQDEARLNHDAIEMYEAKLKTLETEPVISNEEFMKYRNELADILAGIVAEDKTQLREIVVDMIEIKDNESNIIDDANKFIEYMQRKLLKDPCGIFASNGTFIPQPRKVKIFNDYSVMEFLRFVTKHSLVEDLMEQESKRPNWVNH